MMKTERLKKLGKYFWMGVAIYAAVKVLLVVFVLLSITGCSAPNKEHKEKLACFGSDCLKLDIADSDAKRTMGLMNRDMILEDEGMFFVFDSPAMYKFWMKNMKFSIDMIWLNENYTVTHIDKAVMPCSTEPCETYSPDTPAKYVVEVKAGIADKLNIEVGDKAEI
jgi:uncharacterized membrane protein (UPF0127 family)